MKIYKNDASIELSLEDFLELLEEEALDQIIDMVIDLEASGSINGDYDGENIIYMGSIDLNDGDIEDLFDFLDSAENFEIMSEEDLDTIFGSGFLPNEYGFLDDEDMIDSLMSSNEDLKVRRIVQRFRHIDSASA